VNVVPLGTSSTAEDLRKLADRIEAGEEPATSAIVVFTDRVGKTTGRTLCGEQLSYSAWMGMLSYVSHMLYRECQDG
jgi:hypothetical protein